MLLPNLATPILFKIQKKTIKKYPPFKMKLDKTNTLSKP